MTALAMIIGMMPMALGLGEGGEQNAPLGRAVIGGLLCATVATLVFVPSVFALLHGGAARRRPAPSDHQPIMNERVRARRPNATVAEPSASAIAARRPRRWPSPRASPLARPPAACGIYSVRARGIRSARRRHARSRATGASRRPHRERGLSDGGRADARDSAAGQHPGLHRRADLCAHQRLPEALVLRHRRAREARASSWPRSRRPKSTSSSQQARADLETAQANFAPGPDHGGPLASALEDQLRVQAGDGPGGEHAQRDASHGGFECRQRPPARGAAGLREDLRAVRRRDHGAQRRTSACSINAGASAAGRELFHLAAIHTLRVFVAVPEVYSRAARPGALRDPHARRISRASPSAARSCGTPTRSTSASRTLLVEVDVDNPARRAAARAPTSWFTSSCRRRCAPSRCPPTRCSSARRVCRSGSCATARRSSSRSRSAATTATPWRSSRGSSPTDQVIAAPSDSLISGTPVRIAPPPAGGQAMRRPRRRPRSPRRAPARRLHGRPRLHASRRCP